MLRSATASRTDWISRPKALESGTGTALPIKCSASFLCTRLCAGALCQHSLSSERQTRVDARRAFLVDHKPWSCGVGVFQWKLKKEGQVWRTVLVRETWTKGSSVHGPEEHAGNSPWHRANSRTEYFRAWRWWIRSPWLPARSFEVRMGVIIACGLALLQNCRSEQCSALTTREGRYEKRAVSSALTAFADLG